MKESQIHVLSALFTLTYFIFIAFLYWSEPSALAEIPSKAVNTIQDAASKGSVLIGTYEADQRIFNEGVNAFQQDNFVLARDLFAKADPQNRDPGTQFYIAYSYYRQGWGRISNNDELFRKGLETVDRIVSLDPNFNAADETLSIQTPGDLRRELDDGLKITAGDFNPLRIIRKRK
ncbi:MAG: hypothetical protein WBD22_05825 [Pyrinomonadaceae bacterium]